MVMTDFFVKVSEPDFRLPQIVIDNLPIVDPEQVNLVITEYLEQNPVSEPLLEAHVVDDSPHPAYDDLPSLRLLFENGII